MKTEVRMRTGLCAPPLSGEDAKDRGRGRDRNAEEEEAADADGWCDADWPRLALPELAVRDREAIAA